MSADPFSFRTRRGQVDLGELNRLGDTVIAHDRWDVAGGLTLIQTPVGTTMLLRQEEEAKEHFPARIKGASGSDYAWEEVRRTADAQGWEELPGGRSGTLTDKPARERNALVGIPADFTVVVLLELADDGTHYLFSIETVTNVVQVDGTCTETGFYTAKLLYFDTIKGGEALLLDVFLKKLTGPDPVVGDQVHGRLVGYMTRTPTATGKPSNRPLYLGTVGGGAGATFSGALVEGDTAFTIPPIAPTSLLFHRVYYNTDSYFTSAEPTKLTIPVTGRYLIGGGAVSLSLGGSGTYRDLLIRRNFAGTSSWNWLPYRLTVPAGVSASSSGDNLTVSGAFPLNAGDSLELQVRHDGSSSASITIRAFWVHRLDGGISSSAAQNVTIVNQPAEVDPSQASLAAAVYGF